MSPLWSLGLGFVISLGLGPLLLPVLRRLRLGQTVRDVGPQSHLQKTGTPTMGGLLFMVAATVATVVFAPRDDLAWTAIGFMWANGLIGFADDFIKVRMHRPLGVRARTKLGLGIVTGLALAWLALGPLNVGSSVRIPFSPLLWHLSSSAFVVLVVLVAVATTNAVNLTDGLDGLAGGLGMIAAGLFALLAIGQGTFGIAIFCLALAGAVGGFLYFNLHPARVFMGDVGSFGLGAALAAVAVLLRQELLLPIVGLVFVLEALSVAVQVLFFRRTKRRLLRMAPLHHHFELAGLRETQVVHRFWLLGIASAVLAYIAFWA
ncbi:MAG: phospho-N-acetylmuramoyl-pentapeptide-transferase [Thermaerobacter sp.]|nr:phospho-N-acetylmuramoyl-pentapeptide-transferase [Thermaerobacter sp.]